MPGAGATRPTPACPATSRRSSAARVPGAGNSYTFFDLFAGWVRVDGVPVANFASDLVQEPYTALALDERGRYLPDASVWGGNDTQHCDIWSRAMVAYPMNYGNTAYGSGIGFSSWVPSTTGHCGMGAHHVYCLARNRTENLAPQAPPGARRAFLLPGFVPGPAQSPDQACRAAATAANLPNATSFRALLGPVGGSPASKFRLDGGTWYRLDNVPILSTAGELGGAFDGGAAWLAPLALTLDGGRAPFGPVVNLPVWFGAADRASGATSISTCTGWSVGSGSGGIGYADQIGLGSLSATTQPCSQPAALYCLEN